MTPEQQQFMSTIFGATTPQAAEAYQQFLQPYDPEQFQSLFQQAFVDPAMMQYEQQVLPAIQQRFVDANAGSSSALNQALGQSAADISTMLGSQMGQFYQQNQANQLSALGGLTGMLGQRSFEPIVQQQQGILGPLIGAGGQLGGSAMIASALSSKEAKENIRPYQKGLKAIKKFHVKQYDYKEEVGGKKDKVGVIAEEIPVELTTMKDDYLHVDLYGVMGLMINAIKELSEKVEELEAK